MDEPEQATDKVPEHEPPLVVPPVVSLSAPTDYAQLLDSGFAAIQDSRTFRFCLFGGVCIVCVLANLLLPWVFWDSRRFGSREITETLGFTASGGLGAQLAVLAMWLAIGPGSLGWRFLSTCGLVALASSTFVAGLQVPDFPNSGMPPFVALFLISCSFGMFLVGAGLISLINLLLREKLVHVSELTREPHRHQKSYSLAYLVGVMTIFACVLSIIRAVIPPLDDDFPGWLEVIWVVMIMSQFALLSLLFLMSCAQLILRLSGRWTGAILLTVLFVVGVPINLVMLSLYRQFRVESEVIIHTYGYVLGFLFVTCCFLGLIWMCGYRLVARRSH